MTSCFWGAKPGTWCLWILIQHKRVCLKLKHWRDGHCWHQTVSNPTGPIVPKGPMGEDKDTWLMTKCVVTRSIWFRHCKICTADWKSSQDLCLNQNVLVQPNVCFFYCLCAKSDPKKITVLYFSVASQWLRDWARWWSIDVFKTPFSSRSLSLLIIEIRFLVSKLSKFCGEELVIVNQIHDPLGLYIPLDYTMPWILELPKQCMILRWSVWGLGLNISISNFIGFFVWQEVKGATSSINSICWTISLHPKHLN